eukprot:2091879-Alexandrium_andersonii.AAC.1
MRIAQTAPSQPRRGRGGRAPHEEELPGKIHTARTRVWGQPGGARGSGADAGVCCSALPARWLS